MTALSFLYGLFQALEWNAILLPSLSSKSAICASMVIKFTFISIYYLLQKS